MLGKAPGNIEAIRPMKDGVIADFTVTEQMLKQFIKMVHAARLFCAAARASSSACPAARPRSSAAPSANRRSAPAPREVYLIEEPMAAAIGAGLPVSEAIGLDGGRHRRRHHRGRRRSRWAAWSTRARVRVGGDKFDEAIINYIRRNYGMLIGEPTAEADQEEHRLGLPRLRGARRWKSRAATWPKACRAASPSRRNEILEALTDPLNQIVSRREERRWSRPRPSSAPTSPSAA